METGFPEVLDSTILATFRSCHQKYFRMYHPGQDWKPKEESVHLVAGAAFASGIEAARLAFYTQGLPPADAVATGLAALVTAYGDFECPPDSAKSCDRMAGALEFYFDRYPLGDDGTEPLLLGNRRAVEFSFVEPLPFTHPFTGQPMLYSGRADMIAAFAGGTYVFDEKTTSSLGASWSRQWDLRSQFTGYCWAAARAGIHVDGVIVRGISILKTKYDTQQAITNRSQWEIDRWLNQVGQDIRMMETCWRDGYWDYNLDHACTEYGGCAMRQICQSPTPEEWLPMYFEKRVWDPITRQEIKA